MPAALSLSQARRVALAAQGLGRARPATVGPVQLQREISRLGQFQIDSVNVAVRAHYMPAFSRLGAYHPDLLHRAGDRRPRRLFEYWGHAASLLDVELYPAMKHRMAARAAQPWPAVAELTRARPSLLGDVLTLIERSGPLTARQIEQPEERTKGSWWNWSDAKHSLEWLFYIGELTAAGRNSQFERLYDLPSRVLPRGLAQVADPGVESASVDLIRRAAAALGIASLRCLSDYFRMSTAATRAAVAHLEATGELVPTPVSGWGRPTWLWHEARIPRRLDAAALVSPFDSLVFERERLLALFDLHYRIEIYTPAPKRQYGYYVYLFVMGERIAARVDLKADRAAGVLRVQAAWLEPGADETETATRLATELRTMAGWLGLGEVSVMERGNLAATLRRRVAVDQG